jgi:hypothetical protein
MKLRKPPTVPKKNPVLIDKVRSQEYGLWRHFLGDGELALDA